MIPIHPEAVPESAQELRWIIPAGTLTFVGEVAAAPVVVQELVDSGVVEWMRVEPSAIRIRLRDGRSWRADGAAVRSAISAALESPGDWRPVSASGADDVLRAAVDEVIGGGVGDYIRSHGGVLEVISVSGGVVTVSFGGTCAHCPASDITLTDRFEGAVRERFPSLTEVRVAAAPSIAAGRRLLGLLPMSSRG